MMEKRGALQREGLANERVFAQRLHQMWTVVAVVPTVSHSFSQEAQHKLKWATFGWGFEWECRKEGRSHSFCRFKPELSAMLLDQSTA